MTFKIKLSENYFRESTVDYPETQSKIIDCPKCFGRINANEANFCSKCGEPIKDHYDNLKKKAQAGKDAYQKDEQRRIQEFTMGAFNELGMKDDKRSHIIFQKAWDDAHSDGYYAIFNKLEELVEFIDAVEAAREH
jgi:hypothetical protein